MRIYDEVLKEIHSIQRKHYHDRKGMSWEQEKKLINRRISQFLSEKNYKIVHSNGRRVLIKVN